MLRIASGTVAPMEGLSGPQDPGTWRLPWSVAAAFLVVALFGALLVSPLPVGVKRVVSGTGLVTAALLTAASFRYRFLRASGRRRRAWFCFGIAALFATLGNVWLLVYGATAQQGGSPSDLALALSLALGVVGILFFPLARRRGTDLARMILDGVVIGGSVIFIASLSLFPQILHPVVGGGGTALALLVPISDVVIATVAVLLMSRGAPSDRTVLGLVAAGFACNAASDFAYAVVLGRTGAFGFGSLVDLGWITGYTLIVLAVRNPGTLASPGGERPVESSPVTGTVLMFGLFLVAAVLSLNGLHGGSLSTASAVLWLVVLLGVLARQIVLVVDNERLRRILEQQVSDRSRTLRQVTVRSDLLVNAVGDGIYGVDRDGLVTFVNPAAVRILGFEAEDLIGTNAHDRFHARSPGGPPYPPEDCYVTEAIRDHRATNAEEDSYVRADSRNVPVEVTATPLIVDDETIGAVVVFRDVTQRREVDRLKSEFVSMVSHELRTPLTAIRGSLGLIAGGALGELTPAAARMVDITLTSSERLSRLINEILDIERVEAGSLALDPAVHSAVSLVDAAVGQVQVIAEEAGVTVVVDYVHGEVYADADRVVQTLLNLLGNAIKFSDRGGAVTVRAQPRGALVEFRITDQGRGIPEDKLDSIFGRFEQVDSSDAREKGGTGLGLAISRSIVEKQGGRIWAANNPDGGASFRFTLPVPGPQNSAESKVRIDAVTL